MMAVSIAKLLTASDIARRLGQPEARVRWVLATRPHIRPAALAGRVRVYSTAAISLVQDEFDRIDTPRRQGGDNYAS